MRWVGVLTALALGFCGSAWGQNSGGMVEGMFGPRSLGTTLQPRPRSFAGGILTGPAGQFMGRGRATGLTFNPSMWQSDVTQVEQAAVRQRQIESRRALQSPIPGPPVEPPSAPPPPPTEEWFRSPTAQTSGEQGVAGAVSGSGAGGPSPAPTLRPPPLSIGFVPGQVAYDPAASAAMVLGRTPRIARLAPISVTMDRETAILRGRVRTLHDRQLAEDLVRMEPGVWQVRNELVVGEVANRPSP